MDVPLDPVIARRVMGVQTLGVLDCLQRLGKIAPEDPGFGEDRIPVGEVAIEADRMPCRSDGLVMFVDREIEDTKGEIGVGQLRVELDRGDGRFQALLQPRPRFAGWYS